jgi:hypothetical protein
MAPHRDILPSSACESCVALGRGSPPRTIPAQACYLGTRDCRYVPPQVSGCSRSNNTKPFFFPPTNSFLGWPARRSLARWDWNDTTQHCSLSSRPRNGCNGNQSEVLDEEATRNSNEGRGFRLDFQQPPSLGACKMCNRGGGDRELGFRGELQPVRVEPIQAVLNPLMNTIARRQSAIRDAEPMALWIGVMRMRKSQAGPGWRNAWPVRL